MFLPQAERYKALQRGSDAASRARVEPRRTRARDREREIGSQGSCSQLRARARENALSECINNVKHCFSILFNAALVCINIVQHCFVVKRYKNMSRNIKIRHLLSRKNGFRAVSKCALQAHSTFYPSL